MHKDHVAALEALARQGNLESLFSGEPPASTGPEGRTATYQEGMSVLEFLEYVMETIDSATQSYQRLAGAATDTELSDLLRRLIGEAGRTRSVVGNRHDLETLSG